MMSHRALLLALLTAPILGMADVRPAALFADHMIIQRATQAPVWGWADVGEVVTVSGSWGASAQVVTGDDGRWMVRLDTPEAGGPHRITLQGKNTVEIEDVLSGEVWFCSGQSNMDYAMGLLAKVNSRTEPQDQRIAEMIQAEIRSAEDSQLRQFTVARNTAPLESEDALAGAWILASPQSTADFSATAYYFARELRQALKVPVAVIECAWGGTRVEAWIPADSFQQDEAMAGYYAEHLAAMQAALATWDPEASAAEYAAALETWKRRKQGPRPRLAPYPPENPQFPSTLFNAMVHPVIPYAIKGVIWYQGEANVSHNTLNYEQYFRAMIRGWRQHWGQGDFPFYFVQLAGLRAPLTEPVEYNNWASIREQQRRSLGLENTGMAVSHDIGEANDIHPHNKIDVGKRLALWALKQDYQQALSVCSGPLYLRHHIEGDRVIIEFDSVGSGLMAGSKAGIAETQSSGESLQHFQVCGADRQWHWARAQITGTHTIVVSHPEVAAPQVVRYAWAQNPLAANLYNREGLPASIFTTEVDIPVKTGARR
jgi:sialate O-acetylesterase